MTAKMELSAKELKEKCIKTGAIDIYLNEDEELFNQFINQLCKEQRESTNKDELEAAFEEYQDAYFSENGFKPDNECIVSWFTDEFLNAPQPEI